MEAAAPALLSRLAQTLLRRPPSLRELVVIVGYADDYAWFAELMRRLFPNEAESALSAPGVGARVERFANLFAEKHFPLYMPVIEFFFEDGEEPPWSWLRRGIPFDLMGFGYDGVHELWNGYRDGISALLLLVNPPDSFYGESDEIRTAWLESAAERIPQSTLERIPQGGIPAETLCKAVKDTRFEGAALAASWVFDGQLLPRRQLRGRQLRRDIIKEGTEEWRKATHGLLQSGRPRRQLRGRQLRRLRRPLGRRHHQGGHGGVAEGPGTHGLGVQSGRLARGRPPRPLHRDAGHHPAPHT